jgi:alanyl-tRNA synthetase
MELSRHLTRAAGHVAILTAESEGKGLLFVGSSAPGTVAAQAVMAAARGEFHGKGGGNPSSATAVGDPAAPLERARTRARQEAERLAQAGAAAATPERPGRSAGTPASGEKALPEE